ncbi:hypothetical protein F1737_07050 [Methanoplanus sp. FWC-SCC4]|uniref:Uncharacterized protein n=1 Tax=Methanochimaera problematica TaxID=2609417 RepID=A0AA97FDZ4_9EURY|nr:hypothetical protein [Methanoplanus sp. FWC-SCC4]WOF16474.1 hypothetical protein F1737_07050 [Methanoplanus sp. FWC-SCC4]
MTKSKKKLISIVIVLMVAVLVVSIYCVLIGENYNPLITPISTINYSAEKYTFTNSDAETLGEKWYPELVFNANMDYPDIKSLMNEYFGDVDVVWKIYYGKNYGKNQDESQNLKVMLCSCKNNPDVNNRIVSSLNRINKDYDTIFAIRVNSVNRFCDPYYYTANNSGRYWYPIISFKADTTDNEINRLLNKELGHDASWSTIDYKSYDMNYYAALSPDSNQIPEALNHFVDISTYGWIFYEIICFDNRQPDYYPVSINSLSDENENLILDTLKDEGIVTYPSRLVKIEDITFNDILFEKSYTQYENISKSDDIIFIAKFYLRDG